MRPIFLSAILTLLPAALIAQGGIGAVRRVNQPEYRAPDGSISRLRIGNPATSFGAVRVVPARGQFTLGLVLHAGCVGPHSVEHQVAADTITITLFYSLHPCAGLVPLREFLVTLTGLKPRHYLLRVYMEGPGGREGIASGAAPFLSVDVYAL